MADQIKLRRDTAAAWTSTNPTLAPGEPGYETDTGKLKIGTGAAAWTALPYVGATSTYTDEQARDAIGAALVAGTGMTITVDDPGDHITLASSGGGGGGGGNKDPRWTPLTGQTAVDEFNDDTLAAGWVPVNGTGAPSGNVSWLEAGDVLSVFNNGGDSAGCLHGMMFPLASAGGALAAGDGFVAAVSYSSLTTDFAEFGIIVADGTVFGSGKQAVGNLNLRAGSNGLTANYGTYSGYNSRLTFGNQWSPTAAGGNSVPALFGMTWLRFALIAANTWREDLSADGIQWQKGAATFTTSGLTATHAGFYSTSYSTATKHQAAFDCLRRVAGVT